MPKTSNPGRQRLINRHSPKRHNSIADPGQTPPIFVEPEDPINCTVQRCPVGREAASRRILIMRAGAFGDILMGTVILSALRRADPNVHLTWIAEHSEIQAINANPYVDEVLRWNTAYFKKPLRNVAYVTWVRRALSLRKELRLRHFDAFVSLQPEEWPLLMRGSDAKVTVGIFDTFRRFNRDRTTSRYRALYEHSFAFEENPEHRIDQYLQAVGALGYPVDGTESLTMGYTEGDRVSAARYVAGCGGDAAGRYCVVAPSTTWPSKCWAAPQYVELCDVLASEYRFKVILVGSAKERPVIEGIATCLKSPPIVAAGDLTFRQTAALIDGARLVVSGDTGPMHVASALGTPHVAIFGATGANWYGSRSPVGRLIWEPVPCGPCDQKLCPNTGELHMLCMKKIRTDVVLTSIADLLKSAA